MEIHRSIVVSQQPCWTQKELINGKAAFLLKAPPEKMYRASVKLLVAHLEHHGLVECHTTLVAPAVMQHLLVQGFQHPRHLHGSLCMCVSASVRLRVCVSVCVYVCMCVCLCVYTCPSA
jgi:hypothetical protein